MTGRRINCGERLDSNDVGDGVRCLSCRTWLGWDQDRPQGPQVSESRPTTEQELYTRSQLPGTSTDAQSRSQEPSGLHEPAFLSRSPLQQQQEQHPDGQYTVPNQPGSAALRTPAFGTEGPYTPWTPQTSGQPTALQFEQAHANDHPNSFAPERPAVTTPSILHSLAEARQRSGQSPSAYGRQAGFSYPMGLGRGASFPFAGSAGSQHNPFNPNAQPPTDQYFSTIPEQHLPPFHQGSTQPSGLAQFRGGFAAASSQPSAGLQQQAMTTGFQSGSTSSLLPPHLASSGRTPHPDNIVISRDASGQDVQVYRAPCVNCSRRFVPSARNNGKHCTQCCHKSAYQGRDVWAEVGMAMTEEGKRRWNRGVDDGGRWQQI